MSSITKAASVLLVRGEYPAELFVVRRAESLRFMGGFLAFPGGKVSATDRTLPSTLVQHQPPLAAPTLERVVAAARELFEETGVLLARRADGSFPASGSVLSYLRRKLLAEDWSFERVLAWLGLRLHPADFQSLGELTTPPFVPVRFDTAFFLAQLPPEQQAEVWPGELETGEWTTAGRVLERWVRGECLVSPPSLVILEALRDRTAPEMGRQLVTLFGAQSPAEIPAIRFAPHVALVPLFTQSLPPSTHTNAYLVGRGPVYLLDPGPVLPEEQARLFAVLDAHAAAGQRVTAIVLTHHHPDHVGAVMACAERHRVPVHAHALTAARLQGLVSVQHMIQDGDRLDLGPAPDTGGPWYLEAIHTPGHAPGHLAFFEPHYRLLFVGDMVSTLSSVVIAPPDGDLRLYLDSLRRLEQMDCRLLLPAHGSPSARPHHTLAACIAHRKRREGQLVAALRSGPRSVPDLARELYKSVQPALIRFAELQLLAGLEKLQREGLVTAQGPESARTWALVVPCRTPGKYGIASGRATHS